MLLKLILVALLALVVSPVARAQCPGGVCYRPSATYAYTPPTVAYHYLVDDSGQSWHHTDLAWLQTHVASENARIAAKPTFGGSPGGGNGGATAPIHVAPVYAAPAPATCIAGDAYGFTSWLNGVRAANGRGPVRHDPGLSGQAAVNNSYGYGHQYMGSARRQNWGMGAGSTVWSMWMGSPAHQSALLDPTITTIGIAFDGSHWTFNAY